MPIPPDNRARGDVGHIGDHNNIADQLTAISAAITTETGRAETAEALAALKSANLTDIADASAARTALGLGTAAIQASSAFDAAGAAATETTRAQTAEALLAPKGSPALTGTPTAPTAAPLTNTTQVATTAYADAAVAVETARAETAEAALLPLSSLPLPVADGGTAATTAAGARTALGLGTAATQNSTAFDASGAAAAAQSAAQTFATSAVTTETTRAEAAEALLAPLASPALTGNPTAPTQTAGNNSTRLATTAFVAAALPSSLPPSGTAGGDLGSTYPNPQVTGTHLSAPLPVAQGGTGQTAQQAAIDALTGTQGAGLVLRSDGTHATLAAIQAADVPTLNQSTTGTAAGLSATLAISSGGTGQTTRQAAVNALTGTQSSGQYLRSDGTNAGLAAITAGDVPTLNQNTTGTAANITGALSGVPAPTADVSLNSHKITNLTAGVSSTDAANVGQVPVGAYVPVPPTGVIAETFPRALAAAGGSNVAAISAGTIIMAGIWIPAGAVVSNITFCTGSTANESGGTHGWYVLTDSNLVVKGVTADKTGATFWTLSTVTPLALGTPFTTTYSGLHYIGWMINATQVPSAIAHNSSGFGTVLSSLTPALAGKSNTGQTTPPSLGATLTALNNTNTFLLYGNVS